jgi:hypothetical protein
VWVRIVEEEEEKEKEEEELTALCRRSSFPLRKTNNNKKYPKFQ